jgi:hypothetical protein
MDGNKDAGRFHISKASALLPSEKFLICTALIVFSNSSEKDQSDLLDGLETYQLGRSATSSAQHHQYLQKTTAQ